VVGFTYIWLHGGSIKLRDVIGQRTLCVCSSRPRGPITEATEGLNPGVSLRGRTCHGWLGDSLSRNSVCATFGITATKCEPHRKCICLIGVGSDWLHYSPAILLTYIPWRAHWGICSTKEGFAVNSKSKSGDRSSCSQPRTWPCLERRPGKRP